MKRPNILWISLEDCSPRFGCYGDKVARTPNIDRLAAAGTCFPNTFCTAPVCSPSRTAVITGYHATAMAAQHMRTTYETDEFPDLPTPYHAVPPPYVKCFTEDLRVAGYYCTNNGKTDYQFEAPFAAWDENGKPDTVDAIHWRNRPDSEQPFFAVFNLEDTHERRMWPGQEPGFEAGLCPPERTGPCDVEVPPYLPDTAAVREIIARQYDNIAHNDAIVGKLLAQLEEDGLAENTLVMLWADHGEGLPRAKRFLYDSGTQVPLIVRWPGHVAAGEVDRRLVSLIDLAPTVFQVAGLPVPLHFAGKSFLSDSERAYVFGHRDRLDGEYDKSRSVRSARFKYIRNYYPGRERFGFIPYRGVHAAMQAIRLEQLKGVEEFDLPCPPEELFDLETDPFELSNLIANPECGAIKKELSEALDDWQQKYDPDCAFGEEQMRGRLWPDGEQAITAAPLAIVYNEKNPAGFLAGEVCETEAPALLQLACATEGATIGFRRSDSPIWQIYRKPIWLAAGEYRFILRALRYGYLHSEEHSLTMSVGIKS
ncbi:MAG: sulfatase [Chthoniobacterales bacterium]